MQCLRLLLILTAALLLGAAGTPLSEAPSALADANVVTSHAKVQASSFDGVGTVGPPVIKQASNFSAFSKVAHAFDDPNDGRSAQGEGTQNTTVDFTEPLASSVDTSGAASASWTDGDPGDGDDPHGTGTSEFTITLNVTNAASHFSLAGSIEATASAVNTNCTTVSVTSPSGTTFDVSAPAGCGSPEQSVNDSGALGVGTHTFSVVANAFASNANATGGSATATFDLSLSLGCAPPASLGQLAIATGADPACGVQVEFTQGIQQLQTLDELQASLGGGLQAAELASASTDVSLDSHLGDNAGAKAFGPLLESGQDYRVTVVGTYSKWSASQWIDFGVCTGTPENSPMFPSPGVTNSKVGLDAEWRFATPVGSSACDEPAPDTDGSFQISADGGASFQNLTADDQGAGPNAAHKYHYSVTGQGQIIAFLIADPNSTVGNHGVLRITIEAVCENTAVTVWEEASSGNGHSYQAVCSSGVNWDEAEAALESTGGHLATITSSAENSFVFNLIDDTSFWSLADEFCPGPFIGGYQTPGSPEPSGGWSWVTGEPFGYANWAPDEPGDSDFGNENRVAFGRGECGPQVAVAPVWHDVEANESGVHSYVAEWDVAPVSVEFTQAIQQLQTLEELQTDLVGDGKPPVPIVAGKPLAMRVYLAEVDEVQSFSVEASGEVNLTRDITLHPDCSLEEKRRQEAGCRSVDFYFTPPEGPWSVRLVVRDAADTVVADNEFHLTSDDSDAVVLKAVSVCDTKDPGLFGAWHCADPSRLLNTASLIRRLLPTDRVSILMTGDQVKEEATNFTPPNFNCTDRHGHQTTICWWGQVNNDLAAMYGVNDSFATVLGEQVYYFGVVRNEALGTFLGAAFLNTRAAAAKLNYTGMGYEAAPWVVAHELSHAMGLDHTNTASPALIGNHGCWLGERTSTPPYPYTDNMLRSGTAPGTIEVGFDVANHTAIPGDQYYEVMGYCASPPPASAPDVTSWITPFSTLQLLRPGGPLASGASASGATPASIAGDFWLVQGKLDSITQAVDLGPLMKLQLEGPATPGTGTHRIEVHDAQGGLLFTRLFTPAHGHGSPSPGQPVVDAGGAFSELIPVQPGAATIQIYDPLQTLIASIDLEGAAPVIDSITLPLSFTGLQPLSWSVTDPDSTGHTFWVSYSFDGGQTWQDQAMGLTEAGLAVDFDLLAASTGQGTFRVIASDGVNSGEGISQSFTVAGKAPHGEITGPSRKSFRLGDLVWLEAGAWDIDDGTLDDAAVTWSSSRDGTLGTGASLPVYDLTVGQHTISMTARDSDNNTVTDSTSITVFDGPIVEIGAVADVDCSGTVDVADALALLYHIAGLDAGSCKTIGDGEPIAFGDADCNGAIGAGDVTAVLALAADLPARCASPAGHRN